jgi:DNA-directed RNA polymerase alpha subunit
MVPARAVRPLQEERGVETVRELLLLGVQGLRATPGLGPKSVAEIERRMREAGLIFK